MTYMAWNGAAISRPVVGSFLSCNFRDLASISKQSCNSLAKQETSQTQKFIYIPRVQQEPQYLLNTFNSSYTLLFINVQDIISTVYIYCKYVQKAKATTTTASNLTANSKAAKQRQHQTLLSVMSTYARQQWLFRFQSHAIFSKPYNVI